MEQQQLSKEQIRVLRDAFNTFDPENEGFISTDCIGEILETLGHKIKHDQLETIIQEFDTDDEGELDFNEFLELAKRFIEPEEDYDALRKELREAFMLYDKDAKGYLTLDAFKDILRELDSEIPEEELDDIIDEIDLDGSGTVDFEEFMEVMTGE